MRYRQSCVERVIQVTVSLVGEPGSGDADGHLPTGGGGTGNACRGRLRHPRRWGSLLDGEGRRVPFWVPTPVEVILLIVLFLLVSGFAPGTPQEEERPLQS